VSRTAPPLPFLPHVQFSVRPGGAVTVRITSGPPERARGTVELRQIAPGRAELVNLRVAEEHRRHGLGTKLVNAATDGGPSRIEHHLARSQAV